MRTSFINIQASWKQGGGKRPSKELAFKRYEFNHPYNPFRISKRKNRERILHPKTMELNDAVLACFEQLIISIQRLVATPEKINLNQLSVLLSELDRELYTYSTVPCTANIDPEIFEHLNYVLKLLYEWQDYAGFFQKMDENPGSFLRQTSIREGIPLDALIIKTQYLRKIFEQLGQEIHSENSIILDRIKKEHQKHFPASPRIKKR